MKEWRQERTWGNIPPRRTARATIAIIITCCIVYPFGFVFPGLAYSFNGLFAGQQWWTLVTSLFVHGSLAHLAGNMLFLFFFGRALEKIIGPQRFLFAYFAGGVISLFLSGLFYDHNTAIVGASGAISTVIATLMLFNPWRLSFLLTFIPVPLGVAGFSYIIFNIVASLSQSQHSGGTHVAYEAHIIGFVVGLFIGIAWVPAWKKNLLSCLLMFLGFYLLIYGVLHFHLLG